MVRVLRNASLRRLIAAQGISQLGDWLYNVALLALVFERTHSSAWLGATTAARVLPIVLLGPVAGLLGDRFDRRLIMIASDLVRAGTMLGLVAVVQFGLPIWCVPALAAFATAAGSPYPSCAAATIPRLLSKDDLTAANSIRAALGPLAIVTGPLAGAVLVALGGPVLAFAVNAGTFAASALLTAAVANREAFRPIRSGEPEPGLWAAITVGARELVRRREAARLIGADVLCSLCYGVETVVLVVVSMRLGWHESGYGVLLGAIGIGGLIGTAVIGTLVRMAGRRRVISLALLGVAASLPLLALAPFFGTVVLLLLVNGAGSIVVEVCAETVLQEELSDDVFARAYGFAFPVSIAGIAAGSVVAAPLVAVLGLTGALTVIGACVAGYALLVTGSRSAAPTAPALVAG
ncbi:MAG TPA: MFS transporter [Jatrophihabitantaceae bacterium]|nr:MFS transporter [Jatrophihabitantaceae bacterium]